MLTSNFRRSSMNKQPSLSRRPRKLRPKRRNSRNSKSSSKKSWLSSKRRSKKKERKIRENLRKHKTMKICKQSKSKRCNRRWNSKEWRWPKKRLNSKLS